MTLIFFAIAYTLGIIAGRAWTPPLIPLVVLDGAMLLALLLARQSEEGRRAAAMWLGIALGATRYVLATPAVDASHLAYYNGAPGPTVVRGWVAEEPGVRDTTTHLTVEAISLEGPTGKRPVRGRVLAIVSHYPAHAYGDVVLISGSLETPPDIEGFSYREYLAMHGAHSWMPRAAAEGLGVRPGMQVAARRAAYRLKERLHHTIDSILPNPEAGLLSGILLGLGHTLPDEWEEAFRRVGLTHIIVISGYNIGLVLTLFLLGRHVVRHQVALAAGMVGIGAYALFVGASPPVARAALMGALFALGPLLGRRSHSPTALAFATVVMLTANPLTLWGVSFQLSLAATLGLLVMERRLTEALGALVEGRGSRWVRLIHLARDGVLCTLAAQVATLPVIWYHFLELSVVALPANLPVLPAQPLLLFTGALATLGGLIWLPLGRVLAWLAWPVLRGTLFVVELLGRVPGAARTLPPLSTEGVWLIYGTLAAGILALQRVQAHRAPTGPAAPTATPPPAAPPAPAGAGSGTRRFTLLGAGLLVAAVWGAGLALPDGRTHVTFLDVGQGDAILIRSPGGRTVLVDGGAEPVLIGARLGRALPFWQHRVDLVVATHADADHLAGLLPVLQHYRVGAALQPPAMGGTPLTARWEELLREHDVPRVVASRGLRVDVGDDLVLEVLHPPEEALLAAGGDDNANSLVLRVTAGECVFLLTADIDQDTERALLAAGLPLEATVLKVAHHGAAGSTSEAWLRTVRPEAAVVSVGSDNTFGHPAPATMGRLDAAGAATWRTDACGTVDVATDGERLWVSTARACDPSGAGP